MLIPHSPNLLIIAIRIELVLPLLLLDLLQVLVIQDPVVPGLLNLMLQFCYFLQISACLSLYLLPETLDLGLFLQQCLLVLVCVLGAANLAVVVGGGGQYAGGFGVFVGFA